MTFPAIIRLKAIRGKDIPIYLGVDLNDKQYDMTGGTIWFTVKRFITDGDSAALLQKKSPVAALIVDAVSGLIKIPISNTEWEKFPLWYQDFICDLQLLDANLKVTEVAVGTLSVYPSVTLSIS